MAARPFGLVGGLEMEIYGEDRPTAATYPLTLLGLLSALRGDTRSAACSAASSLGHADAHRRPLFDWSTTSRKSITAPTAPGDGPSSVPMPGSTVTAHDLRRHEAVSGGLRGSTHSYWWFVGSPRGWWGSGESICVATRGLSGDSGRSSRGPTTDRGPTEHECEGPTVGADLFLRESRGGFAGSVVPVCCAGLELCQWPVGSAQWRTAELPGGGQQNCPFVANRTARGSLGQWRHPLAGGGLGEADAVAGGHDDVGVVQQPVDGGVGDGLGHEFVEPGGVKVAR